MTELVGELWENVPDLLENAGDTNTRTSAELQLYKVTGTRSSVVPRPNTGQTAVMGPVVNTSNTSSFLALLYKTRHFHDSLPLVKAWLCGGKNAGPQVGSW